MTMVILVGIWQVFATARARAVLARDEAYRELAGRSTEALEKTSTQLELIAADVANLRERVSGIEKVLREVE